MIKSLVTALVLVFSFITFAQPSNASPQWATACATAGNSEEWCGNIDQTVAELIVKAEKLGFRLEHRRIKISFSPWNPRADAVGTPVGTLHFEDGRVSCAQKLVGYLSSGRLTCG